MKELIRQILPEAVFRYLALYLRRFWWMAILALLVLAGCRVFGLWPESLIKAELLLRMRLAR